MIRRPAFNRVNTLNKELSQLPSQVGHQAGANPGFLKRKELAIDNIRHSNLVSTFKNVNKR